MSSSKPLVESAESAGEAPRIDLVAAVNNAAVLANCLARSPDVASGELKLRTYVGYGSAGPAYNRALAESASDYIVFAHQDVYLPKGFLELLKRRMAELDLIAPNWAVAGVIGVDADGAIRGHAWCSASGGVIGEGGGGPADVESLDELLIIVRRASGLHFDPALPGFHLFGTDVIQTAKLMGFRSLALDLPVVHHSHSVPVLGRGYRVSYRYMQRKWRRQLPIPNLVCRIDRSLFRLLVRDARKHLAVRGRTRRTAPQGDPVEIARGLGWEAND